MRLKFRGQSIHFWGTSIYFGVMAVIEEQMYKLLWNKIAQKNVFSDPQADLCRPYNNDISS